MMLARSFEVGKTTIVVAVALAAVLAATTIVSGQQQQDSCKLECYPNTRMILGKGQQANRGEACRWILRTDGKPARLCDHIKCRKVCPNSIVDVPHEAASTAGEPRVEQLLEADSPIAPAAHGIMRHAHGSKLAKAPVPGASSGASFSRASPSSPSTAPASAGGARRVAPTLPPARNAIDDDTPPPISRFLDISPEE